jgi:uncharacterized protein
MFGLPSFHPSFQKLLVLALVVAIVWYGFKFLGRLKQTREAEARQRDLHSADDKNPASVGGSLDVEETVQCRTCGAYVPAHGATNCGKAGCPY